MDIARDDAGNTTASERRAAGSAASGRRAVGALRQNSSLSWQEIDFQNGQLKQCIVSVVPPVVCLGMTSGCTGGTKTDQTLSQRTHHVLQFSVEKQPISNHFT